MDEADGILGRRVQVEKAADKEENTTVNVILEELNTFTGTLLAATNNIANLDPAMYRRVIDNVAALCLLERIIDGATPILEQIQRHCAEQSGKERPTPIGFHR